MLRDVLPDYTHDASGPGPGCTRRVSKWLEPPQQRSGSHLQVHDQARALVDMKSVTGLLRPFCGLSSSKAWHEPELPVREPSTNTYPSEKGPPSPCFLGVLHYLPRRSTALPAGIVRPSALPRPGPPRPNHQPGLWQPPDHPL